MNVLFCHDGPINYDAENGYYSIGFNDKLMSRYESIFGGVGIVTRVERTNVSAYKESDKLSADKYNVTEYPNYLTLSAIFKSKKESNRILEEAIAACDALIIRLPSFLGNRCVKIARKYKKPYLIEVVGCPWDSLRNHGVSGKVLAPYMYLKTKSAVRRASDVLYVTNEFLQRRYPTRGRSIGCSDVELLDTDRDTARASVTDATDPKTLTLGTLGKIDLKYKGHATVLEAMARLKSHGYDLKYQIVGPGNREYLENTAKSLGVSDNVVFTGPMGHDAVFEWLDTVDVYIQPSLTEGMPRALIEAMSRGCPCIASDAGGMPELLDKRYIFKKGSSSALADILMNAEKNGLLLEGERNREFTKQFSPAVINEKRVAFYTAFKSSVE